MDTTFSEASAHLAIVRYLTLKDPKMKIAVITHSKQELEIVCKLLETVELFAEEGRVGGSVHTRYFKA